MSQLGYTWYPQDWWTSQTFRRLKRYPLVRYAIRELFDLMYKEGKPVDMCREYLEDDFGINLSDKEYEKLMEYITIDEAGKWWISSIKKRLSKAEAARENGKKGGRPSSKNNKKSETQKPKKETENKNPQNPPLEIEREIEREIESKNEKESEENIIPARHFLSLNFFLIDDLEKELIRSVSWKESVGMQHSISLDEVDRWIKEFSLHLKASGEVKKSLKDAKKHFASWIRIRIEDEVKKAPKLSSQSASDNSWRTEKRIHPSFPGDWRWSDLAGRWMNRENMNKTDQKKWGVA